MQIRCTGRMSAIGLEMLLPAVVLCYKLTSLCGTPHSM